MCIYECLDACSYWCIFVYMYLYWWCCVFERRIYSHVSYLVALNWLHIHIVLQADLLSSKWWTRHIYFLFSFLPFNTKYMFASFPHRLIIFRTDFIYIFRCHIHVSMRFVYRTNEFNNTEYLECKCDAWYQQKTGEGQLILRGQNKMCAHKCGHKQTRETISNYSEKNRFMS